MSISRDALKQALRDSVSQEFASIPAEDEIDHTFSPGFEKRMNRMIRQQQHTAWRRAGRPAKRLLLVAAILLVFFGTASGPSPMYEELTGFEVTHGEEWDDFRIPNGTTEQIERKYQFKTEPEDFTLILLNNDSNYIMYSYRNELGEEITFTQHPTKYIQFSIDNEYGELWNEKVGDHWVKFYKNGSFIIATWLHDGYLFDITYSNCAGTYTMNELILNIVPAD